MKIGDMGGIRVLRLMAMAGFALSISAPAVETEAQPVQWRGPGRDGAYPDSGLLKAWPEGGPSLVLKKEGLGSGYSTPVIYGGDIYISGRRDGFDVVTRLDTEGNIIWETDYGMAWDQSYPETRSTPTIENDRLYISGGMGTVACLDTGSGKIIWEVNTHDEYQGEFHRWGMAESLLLTEDAVISGPAGRRTALVALDKSDGSLIWETEKVGGVRAYTSPLLIRHNGRGMILANTSDYLFAVDPADGRVLWKYDVVSGLTGDRGRRNNINTPLYHRGEIFMTSGYDAESIMLSLDATGEKVTLKWHNAHMDTHVGGVVLVDGYIYGSNWINNGNGNWVCQEWETGRKMYEEKWYNKGSVIYADGMLYIFEEKQGHVGLLKPDPSGFSLVSSFRIDGGTGPCWAHMSIYDRKLLIRHGEVLFVYDIAAEN